MVEEKKEKRRVDGGGGDTNADDGNCVGIERNSGKEERRRKRFYAPEYSVLHLPSYLC